MWLLVLVRKWKIFEADNLDNLSVDEFEADESIQKIISSYSLELKPFIHSPSAVCK